LEEQAAQKRQQAAEILVQLAKLSGAQTETLKIPQTETLQVPQTETVKVPQTETVKLPQTETLKVLQIGQTIEGKGLYMGVWEPKDRAGNSLNRKFTVYAAPEDLTDESGQKLVATFQDTAKRMTGLRNWHGHDGAGVVNDTQLYRGLADGFAIGKWFIPTRDLLLGTDIDGNKVQNENLAAYNERLGEITMSRRYGCSSYDYPNYYLSLSELADGDANWNPKDHNWLYKDSHCMSCRPCRVEALTI